jgi:predicted 2-oxoglutarate/Fe(II)-dependent dioxygenase YbiX
MKVRFLGISDPLFNDPNSITICLLRSGIMHKVKLQEPNKHKLSVFEHDATLATLWDKLKPVISPHVDQFIKDTKSGLPLGLNPRLRVLRYDATDNDVFDPHFDATTRVTAKENADDLTSLLTVLIYLNDGGGKDFDGGETYFLDSTNPNYEPTKVGPSAGSVVVFEHDLYHSSVPLKYGTKFVLRTDVLFKLDEEAGVDKARKSDNDSNRKHGNALTLFELCEELQVDEDAKTCLSDIGLIDLTLESLIAPGMTAVKQMLFDVLDKDVATLIVDALTLYCLQN